MFRTRIAPSPTGPTHIGTLRTAYFNYLAARASGGRFFVRIDDTDQSRSEKKYEQEFLSSLVWCGIHHDGMFRQSEHLATYQEVAAKLVALGSARQDGDAILLSKCELPKSWKDSVVGEITTTAEDKANAEGTVLIKSDGYPSYHFATVVDDIRLAINFVIRGVDHITNTAKQLAIYNAVGVEPPRYAHIGLICKQNKPLSKRDHESGVQHYIDKGVPPNAMLNYMLRMGWSPTLDNKENSLISPEKAIAMFLTEGKMRAANSNLDEPKLNWYCKKYR